MKYHVGQVIEFEMDVMREGVPCQELTLGRIFAIYEEFAPQIDVRLENGRKLGIMESEVVRVVEMDTIKSIMEE